MPKWREKSLLLLSKLRAMPIFIHAAGRKALHILCDVCNGLNWFMCVREVSFPFARSCSPLLRCHIRNELEHKYHIVFEWISESKCFSKMLSRPIVWGVRAATTTTTTVEAWARKCAREWEIARINKVCVWLCSLCKCGIAFELEKRIDEQTKRNTQRYPRKAYTHTCVYACVLYVLRQRWKKAQHQQKH